MFPKTINQRLEAAIAKHTKERHELADIKRADFKAAIARDTKKIKDRITDMQEELEILNERLKEIGLTANPKSSDIRAAKLSVTRAERALEDKFSTLLEEYENKRIEAALNGQDTIDISGKIINIINRNSKVKDVAYEVEALRVAKEHYETMQIDPAIVQLRCDIEDLTSTINAYKELLSEYEQINQ